MKKFALVLTAATMCATGAYAQMTTAPSNPPASTTAPGTAPRATQANAPAQTKELNQLLASDVVKSDVYDTHENKIGTIDDVLMSKNGSPEQAIIGVGGFLGMGEKDVAIPFSELKMKTRNGKNWFELNKSKDDLKAAATFDTKAHKQM
jgi:hypothetical protein